MSNIIICDLDGTLFNVSQRLGMISKCRDEKDYDVFHQMHITDTLYHGIANILMTYMYANYAKGHYKCHLEHVHIIYVTGRHIKFMGSTINQLNEHHLWSEDCEIRMKPSYNDFTPDFIQKELDTIINQYGKENILFVLDDRPTTVEIYRKAGLLCLQTQNSKGFIEDVKKDNINK